MKKNPMKWTDNNLFTLFNLLRISFSQMNPQYKISLGRAQSHYVINSSRARPRNSQKYRPATHPYTSSNLMPFTSHSYTPSSSETRLSRSESNCMCFERSDENDNEVYVSPSNVISRAYLVHIPKWTFCKSLK